MKNKSYIIKLLLLFSVAIIIVSCSNDKCNPSFSSYFPKNSNFEMIEGKEQYFSISSSMCQEKIQSFTWIIDGNDYATDTTNVTFQACPGTEGKHRVEVKIKYSGGEINKKWEFTVTKKIDPDKPECYTKAIETIQEGIIGVKSSDSSTGMNMSDAYLCINGYLKKTPCNMEARMAAGISLLSIDIANIVPHIGIAFAGSNNGIESYIKTDISPLIEHFGTVAQYSDSSFSFSIDKLLVSIENANFSMNLSGEYDLGDAIMFTSVFQLIKGAMTTGLAYNGFYELPLLYLEKNFEAGLINRLNRDETFLNLQSNGKGEKFLTTAQNTLIDALDNLLKGLTSVESESDTQEDDIFKYWDCGEDAICPPQYSDYSDGDPEEPYEDENNNHRYDEGEKYEDLNGNNEWNDSWQNTGPDTGEDNGLYDDGEPIGTDIITGNRIKFKAGTKLNKLISTVRDNIKGPNPLDLDAFFGVPKGTVKQQFTQLAIPYPEIKLSEFFITPSNLRNLLPIYNKIQKYFFMQTEVEKYKDFGYDGLKDEDEPNYNSGSNPDPNHDNYNLEKNQTDGYDNDGDGMIDLNDTNGDFGIEKNGEFDFLDVNHNGYQDPGTIEICEPFSDTGITVPTGIYGKNNGVWDKLDTEHKWPKGDEVGGPEVNIDLDPKNGSIKDEDQELIDTQYMFLPDATFSGIMVFPDPTINTDNKTLTRNAEFFRFIKKIEDNYYNILLLF